MKSDVNTAELEIDKNPENDKNLGENQSNKEFNEKTINKSYKDHNRSKGRFNIKFVDRKIITDWTQKIFQCYEIFVLNLIESIWIKACKTIRIKSIIKNNNLFELSWAK